MFNGAFWYFPWTDSISLGAGQSGDKANQDTSLSMEPKGANRTKMNSTGREFSWQLWRQESMLIGNNPILLDRSIGDCIRHSSEDEIGFMCQGRLQLWGTKSCWRIITWEAVGRLGGGVYNDNGKSCTNFDIEDEDVGGEVSNLGEGA